jgi:RHS repeat-associated protein
MGNIVGVIDCESEQGCRQVFDAFGNVIGDFVLLQCASDHDWADKPCHLSTFAGLMTEKCPPENATPVSRMPTGGFNWRGNEGSITDRVLEDMPDSETCAWRPEPLPEPCHLRWSSDTRPSTGFVYMQARYYEPATGRFLTADPVPYGMDSLLTGQNNRWTYCASDPVNFSDPSGRWIIFALALILVVLLLLVHLVPLFVGIAKALCWVIDGPEGYNNFLEWSAGQLNKINWGNWVTGSLLGILVSIALAILNFGLAVAIFIGLAVDFIYNWIVADARSPDDMPEDGNRDARDAIVYTGVSVAYATRLAPRAQPTVDSRRLPHPRVAQFS